MSWGFYILLFGRIFDLAIIVGFFVIAVSLSFDFSKLLFFLRRVYFLQFPVVVHLTLCYIRLLVVVTGFYPPFFFGFGDFGHFNFSRFRPLLLICLLMLTRLPINHQFLQKHHLFFTSIDKILHLLKLQKLLQFIFDIIVILKIVALISDISSFLLVPTELEGAAQNWKDYDTHKV